MPSLSTHKQTYLSERLSGLGAGVQTLPAFARLTGEEALLDKLTPIGSKALLARAHLSDELGSKFAAYAGANVLITGAGGSIGQELCRQVVGCQPRKIVLFELSELALYNIHSEIKVLTAQAGIELVAVLGSIGDEMLVEQVLIGHQIDAVLHAAAYKHVPIVESNIRVGMSNNALGTAVLAAKSRDAGVKRFVLVSSDKAVRPSNVMGASKRFAELLVQDLAARSKGTIFSIVRFGNVLGSSGSVVPLFQEQIARGGPVTLTDANVTRYFMTIEEASQLVLMAGSFAEGGEVYVLDMGQPVRVRDLAHRLIHAAGFTVRDELNPDGDIEVICTGMRPGEKMHEELMMAKGGQSTAHPKIIRVREECLSELEMASTLRALREAIKVGTDEAVLAALARAVPEYTPQNLPESALPVQIVRARRSVTHRSHEIPSD
jgi:FlaA1/EpsC-like NDP-sugar epimerase